MLDLFLLVEVDGRQMPVTLDEILAFLKEDEKSDFKDLIAICREDQWRIQASADKNGELDISDAAIVSASERLAENALCFFLVVKTRLTPYLRQLGRTIDFAMEGG